MNGIYPAWQWLTVCELENDHRNSECSHGKWWCSIVYGQRPLGGPGSLIGWKPPRPRIFSPSRVTVDPIPSPAEIWSSSVCVLFSMFFSGRAFACGMRETFEPDIVIEDVSYDTFYALLEFLVWTLSQVTRNGDNGYLCICMLRGYQGRWKPGLLLMSWIYAELQGIKDNKRMHPHPDTTSCRLKKIGVSGFIPKSEYVFQNNVMKLGTFWSPHFPCYNHSIPQFNASMLRSLDV